MQINEQIKGLMEVGCFGFSEMIWLVVTLSSLSEVLESLLKLSVTPMFTYCVKENHVNRFFDIR